MHFFDKATLLFRGKELPNSSASASIFTNKRQRKGKKEGSGFRLTVLEITFVGPAGVVLFEFFTPMGRIYLFQTHTPLEPLITKVDFVWFAENHMWSIYF